jgi:hypothetical protein
MPFASILGADHHKRTIIFGAALYIVKLLNHLFGSDQDVVMAGAIAYVFPNLPMLRTVAESYTRWMYSEFEEEFKRQFTLSCNLVQIEGTKIDIHGYIHAI